MALARRTLLRGALFGGGAAALAPALSACGASAAASTDAVQYWNPFTGGDGALMKEMVTEVQGAAPGLKVDTTVLDWGQSYYTKLAMASAGGRGPDVAIMHVSRFAGYAPGGLLDPWDMDLFREFGVTLDDINPVTGKRGRYDGDQYALPLDTHPFVVFYDKDVMDRAGLVDSDGRLIPFGGPDGYLEAAEKLRSVNKGGLGPVYGHVNDAAQNWRMFWSLYRQTGAEFVLTGKKTQVDRDTAVKVLTFMQKLVAPQCRTMDPTTSVGSFASRKAPMIFTGEWDSAAFSQIKGIELGAAPFPQIYDSPAGWADAHMFVLPHQKNPDEERRRTVHRMVAELLKASFTWARAGHIPGYLPIVESRKYRQLEPQVEYAAAAKTPALDPPAWFMGAGAEAQVQLCQAMQTALVGANSAAVAVDKMIKALDFYLSKPDPA
ncbi:extracellular solute-binding protein [Streptomyces sp. SID8379]|uniref:extracellular solute-binding protein n=1 Tax=unclassified Streptomyces TaxID=2593676 RepID=UPI00036F2697|nr:MULTISPECIES: extracellular solute-binding protein [unclassified Streptomyces]MYW63106.1 extracellular solute-binding protein [Streptomyces sp. SID8379]